MFENILKTSSIPFSKTKTLSSGCTCVFLEWENFGVLDQQTAPSTSHQMDCEVSLFPQELDWFMNEALWVASKFKEIPFLFTCAT